MAYSETTFVNESLPGLRESNGTGWFIGIIVTLALLAIGYMVFSANSASQDFGAALTGSTVKVELEKSHGSGVHIGDGLILTAAHVVSEGVVVKIKTDDGKEREATVLWASKANDVALLRTSSAGISSSPLSCAPVELGGAVRAYGSPLDIEFISTYGHVVGLPAPRDDWASVATVDMEIIPGMSGGGVLNEQGEVVGIAVGLATLPIGFSVSATGIGFVVPSTVICGLLGRT